MFVDRLPTTLAHVRHGATRSVPACWFGVDRSTVAWGYRLRQGLRAVARLAILISVGVVLLDAPTRTGSGRQESCPFLTSFLARSDSPGPAESWPGTGWPVSPSPHHRTPVKALSGALGVLPIPRTAGPNP
ncbi:hypothetical protein GCM10010384_50950 [Streptomyces djakartensis]|uniref:Uncharacterized protein n=1 Tax=Streptomyces djakartensis TaxID=68193 RepID=A0ABQ3A9C4_9ACTN|nr:hypothetical protein GCM10010384_50950 [Streptomyces djakartensis]